MTRHTDTYKEIFRATSVFGGVQVVNIVLALIRSKLVAVLLGPLGMGIFSIFISTTGLIASLTGFGLGTSAVKNVAAAADEDDNERLANIVAIFRRLMWITGCIGFLVTLVLSPFLSELAFKNNDYTNAFMLLSISLLVTQINAGQNAILQGLRKIHFLAKASVFGSVLGLITSIPLYYFFGTHGIVPAIVITSVCTLSISWFFVNKIKIPQVTVSKVSFKLESTGMLKMGFLISLSGLFSVGASYIERIFISNVGGLAEVGLFAAGFSIISTYVGMVFTAMSTDYYPRLASIAHDRLACNKAVNQQAEIALLILAPILTAFLVFINLAVIVLYSKSFSGVVGMVQWATLGIYLKALGWSVGFIFLAKGASKAFFWNELSFNIYLLAMNMTGYYFFGLTGLGASFLIAYTMYVLQVLIVSRKLYTFSFERDTIKIFTIQFSIAVLCFLSMHFLNEFAAYLIGCLLIAGSTFYTWKELNRRIDIKRLIVSKIRK